MSSSHPLDYFPAPVREAHARWLATRDPAALDIVVLAIVDHYRTSQSRLAFPGPLVDSARLIEDLGYDSLAMAEVVFFIEDVFKVTVSNADILAVRSIADLRAHLLTQVPAA